ncbi:conserved hypothetical protein [Ricinus communis]|uniref:Uncharacterized protein n=1 Tax=Ricinus communis TaxID=3988 RepID=B9RHJ6_RICCO|nr:conserved hypothetical protein [Ricinus communis]
MQDPHNATLFCPSKGIGISAEVIDKPSNRDAVKMASSSKHPPAPFQCGFFSSSSV